MKNSSLPSWCKPAALRRFVALPLVLVSAALLGACGGGGDACSNSDTLSVSLAYDGDNRIVYSPGPAALSFKPSISGVPGSCISDAVFTATGLPTSLSINRNTGEISGSIGSVIEGTCFTLGGGALVASRGGVCAAGATFVPPVITVQMQLDGYSPLLVSLSLLPLAP